jgi:integral membrane protein
MTRADRVIRWFRISAIAEAISWTGLLIGMLFKYVLSDNEIGVEVFGPIHGVIFLVYLAMTIAAAVVCRWRWTTTALGLVAGIPPFATYAFEVWALRSGRLRPPARATAAA